MTLGTVVGVVVAALHALGIASAVHAALNPRTAQGAIAWSISLITFPYIALPFYWVFGRRSYNGYILARRRGREEIQRLAVRLLQHAPRFARRLPDSGAAALERLVHIPVTGKNRLRLLIDGDATFAAIFEAIEKAEHYVLVQFFIVRDDALGRELQRRLIEKAAAGVRVLVLYDEFGSIALTRKWRQELADAGVAVVPFQSTRGRLNRFQINFRNHRKMVIVDGVRAFVGGSNVGVEYLGRKPGVGAWRDTHVEILGPSVTVCQLVFLEDWHWATDEVPELDWEPREAPDGDQQVLVFPTGPADQLESCGLFFTAAIHAARERIWIASPYFVPDRQIISALQLAALRGVDVRILLPAHADHLFVYLASHAFYDEVLPAGVKLFRYQPGFLHQKVMVVDRRFASVGTANLDNRSFRLNFEITILVADEPFADEVAAMLEADFEKSRPVAIGDLAEKGFWFRLGVAVARLMAPVL